MPPPTTSCDFDRLRWLLVGELSADQERVVTEHVARCPSCQRQLESFAGEGAWWSDVRMSLQKNAPHLGKSEQLADGDNPSQPLDSPTFPSSSGAGKGVFAADFAVDFLDPCERPDTIGRLEEFEILEVIGRGGMGVVLKGHQRELGRYVAVKVMAPHLAASGAARKRFAREARAAAAIVHPHVMAIHSVNPAGRLPYLVMPYVSCESLQQRLDRDGPLQLREILRIGHQIASGLSAAHAQGLVHRDVKPANILLEKGVDRVMLTDFGLARAVDDASLTRTGVIAGTPQYMSPEQARGEAVDARSDLFSLGSVLYTMAAGRPPFRAETSYGILRRITDTEPRAIQDVNSEIPAWVSQVISRLHAKEIGERFASAEEVAAVLERCLAHVQQPTVVELPACAVVGAAGKDVKAGSRIAKRHLLYLCAFTALTCVLAAAATIGLFKNDHESDGLTDPTTLPTMSPANVDSTLETTPSYPKWDEVQGQIEELSDDADDFQSRAQRLWDNPPEGATSRSIQE